MDPFDLEAYLARIGYDGGTTPALATLAALQHTHTLAIPFENLDPLLDRRVKLDLESLQAKLVRGRRGGYCFEQNLLFRAALHALGFEATCLAARVYLDRPKDAGIPARTHLALRVVVEGRAWLADAGFGGLTPTAPIALGTSDAQATPLEPCRVVPAGAARDLEVRVAGTWKHLYRFDLDEPAAVDNEMANHYVATHPASFFRNAIMAARVAPDGRHTLIDDRLSFQRPDGHRETRTLADAEAVGEALSRIFGIAVPDVAGLAAAFERVTAGRRAGQGTGAIFRHDAIALTRPDILASRRDRMRKDTP